jgi:hypothetical protein
MPDKQDIRQPLPHFTYKAAEPDGELQQGDVLQRTPEISNIIERYHSYYIQPEYTHFIVLTQSCDLVRRPNVQEIRAPYITIAAVRSLSSVIEREAKRYQRNWILKRADAVSRRDEKYLLDFLGKVFNNNNSEYFYLHEDVNLGFEERSCAFLRLSIALKREHYETCRAARLLSLDSNFQAKLGWHIGNIYSRVGTEDWVPTKIATDEEWQVFLKKVLSEYVYFVDDRKQEYVKKHETENLGQTRDAARDLINASPEWKRRDEQIEAAVELLIAGHYIDSTKKEEAERFLKNSPAFKS